MMPGGNRSNLQPPMHFRRHGTAEPGFGGPMGITPPRSPATSPRPGTTRRERERNRDDDEPPARRSQDRQRSREARREDSTASSMPNDGESRLAKLERIVQESVDEINKLKTAAADFQARTGNDHNRINAMESALPERIHRCEERQANHIEILNGFAKTAAEQISTLQHRMNQMENQNAGQSQPSASGPTPGFGGPNPVTSQTFNIGSPISDPFNVRPPSPQTPPQPSDPWATYRQNPPMPQSNPSHVFIAKEWNVSDKKTSKAMNLFNGSAHAYRNWSDRVKDHCKEVNLGYAHVFNLIEAQGSKIVQANLQMGMLENGVTVDFKWLSQHLWVFIGKNINDDLHGRRLALTQNDADNGFELWRALYIENEGGAEQVALGGMSNLHAFPQCPRVEDLQHWLGQWQMTRQKFGAGLPEAHLKQMFLNMLPPSVSEKLRERRDLVSLQQYINEIDLDLGRLNDAKLAKIHAQRMSNALKPGSRTSVNAVIEEPTQSVPVHQDMNDGNVEIVKKLDTLIAALTNNNQPRGRADTRSSSKDRQQRSKSPRGIDPAWEKEGKGCLHCGAKGHKRRECHKFKKLLADNGDKLPSDYKGAYEKWKEQRSKKTSIAAVTPVSELDLSDEDDFPETDLVWSLPTRCCLKSLPIPIAPVSNSFSAIGEDDEEEVMAALQQLTPNIRVGPKIPQKQAKGSQKLSKQQIAKIADQVRKGEIELPSLDLACNSDYEAVWALVDSGAGKSVANKSKHFKHVATKNQPSASRMATANGTELKSRGTFKVQAQTVEGQKLSPTFEDADVDMPIIAVNDISHNDSEVIFRQEDSELVDGETGRRSKFTKRKGVYFMKMFYKKGQCMDDCNCGDEPVFARPGTP